MRNALFALPLIFSAGAALAAGNVISRDAHGNNVVIIAEAKFNVPGRLPGLCQINGTINDQINGTINEVWGGKAFRKGQAISLPIPCGSDPQPLRPLRPAGDAQLVDPQVLLASKQGTAHLTDAGALIWRASPSSYGTWGERERLSGVRWRDAAAETGFALAEGTWCDIGPTFVRKFPSPSRPSFSKPSIPLLILKFLKRGENA